MGTKLSRSTPNETEPLSQETIEELCTDTEFTEEELIKLHANFHKDCPNGKLTLDHFQKEYRKIMGKPSKKTLDYVKHMFSVYDQDKNKFIDFREFVMALSVASAVNHVRLVETLFSMFDLDNDGKITKDEIGKMLHTLVDVTDSNRKRYLDDSNERNLTKRTHLQNSIDEAFHELNINHDDYITKNEFIEWYMGSGFLSDVKSHEKKISQQPYTEEDKRRSPLIESNQYHRNKNKKDKVNSSQFIYMTRMIEKKSLPVVNTMDETHLNNPIVQKKLCTDENDLHNLKDNDRWKDLFNSVFERSHGQNLEDVEQPTTTNDHNRINRFNQFKQPYKRQKSNDRSASPDIVTTWL